MEQMNGLRTQGFAEIVSGRQIVAKSIVLVRLNNYFRLGLILF